MCVCVRLLIFSETHIMRPRDEIEIRYYNNAFYAISSHNDLQPICLWESSHNLKIVDPGFNPEKNLFPFDNWVQIIFLLSYIQAPWPLIYSLKNVTETLIRLHLNRLVECGIFNLCIQIRGGLRLCLSAFVRNENTLKRARYYSPLSRQPAAYPRRTIAIHIINLVFVIIAVLILQC